MKRKYMINTRNPVIRASEQWAQNTPSVRPRATTNVETGSSSTRVKDGTGLLKKIKKIFKSGDKGVEDRLDHINLKGKHSGTPGYRYYGGQAEQNKPLNNQVVRERTLTGPEKNKIEEIIQAMMRDPKNKLDKSSMFAIATAQAKKMDLEAIEHSDEKTIRELFTDKELAAIEKNDALYENAKEKLKLARNLIIAVRDNKLDSVRATDSQKRAALSFKSRTKDGRDIPSAIDALATRL